MSELKIVSLLLGAVFSLSGLAALVKPQAAVDVLKAFPRNKSAGWILTAICIAWSGWLIYMMPLGGFEKYKNLIYVLMPVLFFLIITYMGELLAARALGGILMLLPYPMLEATIGSQSAYKYVIIILAYIMVVKGMLLTLSPYMFRRYAQLASGNNSALRILSGLWLVFGVLLILLGLFEY